MEGHKPTHNQLQSNLIKRIERSVTMRAFITALSPNLIKRIESITIVAENMISARESHKEN